ncbi:MAG: hypothetical protein HWN65_14390 [Candidatus Helarchaeota archaeon]|nr:hypothetical protein [Candidatus Helarchaeota archaeon]
MVEESTERKPAFKGGTGVVTPIEALKHQTEQLTVTVFVKEKVREQSIQSRWDRKRHRVSIFLVGDPTGCIRLTLWDEEIDLVEVGTSITIEGAFVRRTSRRQRILNLHKGARIVPPSHAVQFNATNNLSEKATVDFGPWFGTWGFPPYQGWW